MVFSVLNSIFTPGFLLNMESFLKQQVLVYSETLGQNWLKSVRLKLSYRLIYAAYFSVMGFKYFNQLFSTMKQSS